MLRSLPVGAFRDTRKSTAAYACMRARGNDCLVQIQVTIRTGGATQPARGIWDTWSSTRRRLQAWQMVANKEVTIDAPCPRDHPDLRCYAAILWVPFVTRAEAPRLMRACEHGKTSASARPARPSGSAVLRSLPVGFG